MEKQITELNTYQEILNGLDKLEDKLHVIIEFYEELGILRQRRKHLIENLKERDRIEAQRTKVALRRKVTISGSDHDKRLSNIGEHLEKKKSIKLIYNFLEDLSSYHEDVNRKISDLQHRLKPDPKLNEGLELDKVLAQLQAEKDEIDEKIVQFVIKDVIEGKEELFNVISNLEDENNEMENTIIFLEGRVDYLKDTITALMLENQLLKKETNRSSDIVIKSVLRGTHDSLLLPMSLKVNHSGSDFSDDNFSMVLEDIPSIERTTMDSFTLDADLALWSTDEASIQVQVNRIGSNFKIMEVNQMKLNLLKRYVQKHGSKYINKHTLIDPTKGMSLWHNK